MAGMETHHAILRLVQDPQTYLVPVVDDTIGQSVITEDILGIESVRKIIAAANRMPSNDALILCLIVRANSITLEAQQALLKIVEEPPETTRFIFVLPIGVQLLPTLMSRLSVAALEQLAVTEAFNTFKAMKLAERMKMIEDVQKKKDQIWQAEIKSGLMAYLVDRKRSHTASELRSLHFVATTLLTRGAANKMLLEELALTL
jgi:DNA polymerase III delta prime subunit